MTKHTPGPWTWNGKFTVTIPHVDGDVSFRVNPEDARLIAAAPDLLHIAHAAYHALKSYEHSNASPDLAAAVAAALDLTIAKAEGPSE